MKLVVSTLLLSAVLCSCQSRKTFREQMINEIHTKITSGICSNFPSGIILSNIKLGELVNVDHEGMTDLTYEFDYELNGIKKHQNSALVRLKRGRIYRLVALGSYCNFSID